MSGSRTRDGIFEHCRAQNTEGIPRPSCAGSAIRAATNSFAARHASTRSRPRARFVAIADDSAQPVPWTCSPSRTRGPRSSSRAAAVDQHVDRLVAAEVAALDQHGGIELSRERAARGDRPRRASSTGMPVSSASSRAFGVSSVRCGRSACERVVEQLVDERDVAARRCQHRIPHDRRVGQLRARCAIAFAIARRAEHADLDGARPRRRSAGTRAAAPTTSGSHRVAADRRRSCSARSAR